MSGFRAKFPAGSVALSAYRDQHFKGSRAEQEKALLTSSTLYVGNLSYYTTEEQIHELFGKCGDIKRIIMGLDKVKKTPCGFCFVEFYTREDGENAMRYVNGTRLDDRIIRTDWDHGFKEGRQYGRGKSGGQVRDEYRTDYDEGRGGYGKIVSNKITQARDPIFYTREDGENAMRYVNGTRLDDRIIRTDWDHGFKEGRQYGRGKSGGQLRDEYRTDYDEGRGGYGKIVSNKITQARDPM